SELASCFEAAPITDDDAFQFRTVKLALSDPAHPDHRLAELIGRAAMTRLPLLPRELLLELVCPDVPATALARPAAADEVARPIERLFGPEAPLLAEDLMLPPAARLPHGSPALI